MTSTPPPTPVDAPLAVDTLVWLRWLGAWYMARVVETSASEFASKPRVRLHVLGESETADKWLPANSPLLRALDELPAPDARVGALPSAGDCVQLLVADRALRTRLEGGKALVGRVRQVRMSRDASVVEVEHPDEDEDEGGEWTRRTRRTLHIGNGYLRVISEDAFETQRRRLAGGSKAVERPTALLV